MTNEELKEYRRNYYIAHKEEIKIRSRAYWATRREQCNATARKRYQKDKTHKVEYRKAHKVQTRENRLRLRYGISIADYNAMYEQQQGKCACCGEQKKLHVDHCHVTGSVRWLLCQQCNSMVGYSRDNPELLRNAARLLESLETDVICRIKK